MKEKDSSHKIIPSKGKQKPFSIRWIIGLLKTLGSAFVMLQTNILNLIKTFRDSIAKPRSADDDSSTRWSFNLSLTETFLGIFIALFTIGQVTIWLISISKSAIDQSRVELRNKLINQTYEALIFRTTVTPLCVVAGQSRLEYLVCDSQNLIAIDDFEIPSNSSPERLAVRHIFDPASQDVLAIDRYEYTDNGELAQKKRVIFQKVLGVVKCVYIESYYGPTGLLHQNKFHGACGAGMMEIPTDTYPISFSPPPIILSMPYR